MRKDYFCGWYYRCQSKEQTVAVIPAVHVSNGMRSGSVQIISDQGNWNAVVPVRGIGVRTDRPYAVLGENIFQEDGVRLNLHTEAVRAAGELAFGKPTPIRYDIMGPFRYMPFMECRHSVFSVRHTVNGALNINGTDYRFENGVGYIEGDRGRSFPRHYAWTQCCFADGSLMLSVAEIPLGPIRFNGIISVVRLHEKEYRLATYLGAKAVKIGDGELVIKQGDFVLSAALLEKNAYPLCAPIGGAMTRLVRENVACHARYHFSEKGRVLLSFETSKAAFEYEYPQGD